MNKLLCLLCVIALAGNSRGQTKAPAEINHAVDFPKGDLAWSVTVDRSAHKPAPGSKPEAKLRQISRLDSIRVGNLRHDVAKMTDGTTDEWWWAEAISVVMSKAQGSQQIVTRRGRYMAELRLDESTFSWVNATNFKGMKSLAGKNCRYYQAELDYTFDEKKKVEAWIDEKTSLPVAYEDAGDVFYFTFNPDVPSTPLVLPPDFQKVLEKCTANFAPAKRSTPAPH